VALDEHPQVGERRGARRGTARLVGEEVRRSRDLYGAQGVRRVRGFGPYTPTMEAEASSGSRSVATSAGSSADTHDVSMVEPWSTATGQSVPRPVPRAAFSSR
jgi:hypothetical protein